jgi:TRASH domain-containing protein
MKAMKKLAAISVSVCILGGVLAALAAKKAETKVKPYTLKTCIISGDKLGEMGKPFVFTNDNREIKLCCKSCLKDFKKEPAKYVKKIEEAEAKEKAKATK